MYSEEYLLGLLPAGNSKAILNVAVVVIVIVVVAFISYELLWWVRVTWICTLQGTMTSPRY